MKLSEAQRRAMTLSAKRTEFLRRVRDDEDLFPLMADIGYGWAVTEGLVTKHPAWFEFDLTPAGLRSLQGGKDG